MITYDYKQQKYIRMCTKGLLILFHRFLAGFKNSFFFFPLCFLFLLSSLKATWLAFIDHLVHFFENFLGNFDFVLSVVGLYHF